MHSPSDPAPHTHPAPTGATTPARRAARAPLPLAGALSPCATCPIGPACPFFGPASPAAH